MNSFVNSENNITSISFIDENNDVSIPGLWSQIIHNMFLFLLLLAFVMVINFLFFILCLKCHQYYIEDDLEAKRKKYVSLILLLSSQKNQENRKNQKNIQKEQDKDKEQEHNKENDKENENELE